MESSDKTIDLIGVKLTGDPNVPAGQTTFQFSMSQAIVLTQSQQDDIEFLESLHQNGPFHSTENPAHLKQPFKIPTGMAALREEEAIDAETLPDHCLGRLLTIAVSNLRIHPV